MSVKVVIPGPLTTVQDAGRYGYMNSGIGTSGVMDEVSYKKANYLVGNENGEAVLEVTLFGGTMEFTEDAVIAVTGATMDVKINEKPTEMYRAYQVKAGDILSLGMVTAGCRTYVAFAGGIDVPVVLGSRSTNLKCKMGGYEGRALAAGDIFEIGKNGRSYEALKDRMAKPDVYTSPITVRVIEGPQEEYFTEAGKKTFYNETYTISDQSDRMGYRMEGAPIESVNGIALGSIQVPTNGKPIILLADRQTTGGYAKIATVCSFDIPKLVQGKPGDQVRFQKISLDEAAKIWKTESGER